MPTYAYACKDCSHEFDIVQSFTDDSLTECPSCEGTLRKKFNSVGVVFKGSGFYRNDSRSEGSGSTASSSIPAGEKGGSTSESSPTPSTADSGSSSTSGADSSTSSSSSSSPATVSAGSAA
ncbi:FmdB family transcriptional regulator [Cellulosimicrobium funkei]|nr:FmdB family transcriptional regulator [Cellulosimicrobium funkei]